jgi:uncharacterized protein YjbJ (UPF0337 family)
MNRDRIEGRWKQVSGRLREQWGMLTSDQRSVVAGRHDQLAGRAQEQYGITKEESLCQLKDFLHRNRRWNPSNRETNWRLRWIS